MATEKAYIAILTPDDSASEIGRVTFAYNPKEFDYKKTAKWKTKPARGAATAPPPEFQGTDPAKISVEVFLDGYETTNDITSDIMKLQSCCAPMSSTISSNAPSPPYVLFGWGSHVHMKAYVESVDVKITMFGSDGTPLRGTCTVAMTELGNDPPLQNPTSGGRRTVRSHLVLEGDTLAAVAFGEYGKADWWRPIAEANGIDNPMRIRPGTRLLLPDIDDVLAHA